MRLMLIACEILFRELSYLAARSKNRIDIRFLPKGLHDIGRVPMARRLSDELEIVENLEVDGARYDAVLLGYALCSGGVTGLRAGSIPIVLPRGHDCITLFLGGSQRYLDYFETHPGTYFKTAGWIERGEGLLQDTPGKTLSPYGVNMSFTELAARYGEENARFIWEELSRMRHYNRLTYIETGIEPDDRFERETERLAAEKGWEYEKLVGSLDLLYRFLEGRWNEEDFLVVRPGEEIAFDYDGHIVKALPAKPDLPAPA